MQFLVLSKTNSHASSGQHSNFFSLSIYPAGWILTWNSTTLPIGATPASTWACCSLKEARTQILTRYKLVQLHQFCRSAANLQWLGMWPNTCQLLTESRRATQPLTAERRGSKLCMILDPFSKPTLQQGWLPKTTRVPHGTSHPDLARCVNKAPLEPQPLHHLLGHNREFGKATACLAYPRCGISMPWANTLQSLCLRPT